MTLEEFKKDVLGSMDKLPSNWRNGQKVFNYIDKKYGVARIVQFHDGVDCFYNDKAIDKFIEESYKRYVESIS